MKVSASLTRRLIVTLTLGAVVLWLVGAVVTAGLLRARLNEAFDGGLRETAERLLPLAIDGMDADPDRESEGREVPQLDADADQYDEYIVYQVRRSDGGVTLRSHDAPLQGFPVPLTEGFSTAGAWRIYTLAPRAGGKVMQVAEDLQHRNDTLLFSLATLLLPIALLIPLFATGIFLAVRSGLRPLLRLRNEIARRHASNLAPLVVNGLPVELRPIADAVQTLIERLRAALEAERAFAANSAHELRTPIAGSLAQIQRLIAELGEHPADLRAARARAALVEDSLRRLRQLAEKLLDLSRADAGIAVAGQDIDLLPALRLLITDAQRRVGQPGLIRFDIASGAKLRAPLDIDAFGILMRNLIDNALLHGQAGKPIEIAVPSNGLLEISNASPVVPADRLPVLTKRFERGGSPARGSGLGLAIAETILTQAGGRLELLSPAPGRPDGFCVRAIFSAP